jgi:hypothetical protein
MKPAKECVNVTLKEMERNPSKQNDLNYINVRMYLDMGQYL